MELRIWRGVWRGLQYRVWGFRTLMKCHPTFSFVDTYLSVSAISSVCSSLEGSCGPGLWCYRWLLENSYFPLRITDALSLPTPINRPFSSDYSHWLYPCSSHTLSTYLLAYWCPSQTRHPSQFKASLFQPLSRQGLVLDILH